MYTYFVICGIIFNGLVLFTIIWFIISTISARKINKQIQIQYKEELVEAEKAWQEWAKKHAELEQAWEKATDFSKHLLCMVSCLQHETTRYHFKSTGENASLLNLGQ